MIDDDGSPQRTACTPNATANTPRKKDDDNEGDDDDEDDDDDDLIMIKVLDYFL